MADVAYTFSDAAGRFRDSRGRFVSEQAVRSVVDQLADGASERMARASERLLAGELSLSAWTSEMQQHIRLAHSAAAILAHGGAEQMTQARWGAVGRAVRDEYQFLRGFAADIAEGRQALNGSLLARARQYGQGSRVQFERVRRAGQKERGFAGERNILGTAEHCGQCVAQTERGTVAIGSLVPVGRRTCRAQCRCRIAYVRDVAAQQAA